MSSIEQQSKGKKEGEIRYLTPLNIDTSKKKKYCMFQKSGIKYVDYKDPDFLMRFIKKEDLIILFYFRAPLPKTIVLIRNILSHVTLKDQTQ